MTTKDAHVRRAGLGARRVLGLLLSLPAIALSQGESPADHYRRAQQAMQAKDYESAAEAWKAFIAVAPEIPEARSNLGLVYHLQRDYESAIGQFRAALRQNSRLLAAKVFLGIDYYLTSRPDLAIQELEGARALDPKNVLARKWLAMSYAQADRHASAIAELQACRRLDPTDHELVFHLGRAYLKLSTQAFLAVRRAGLESAWLFLLRGQQFVRQGDTRNALDELGHAARLDPRLPGIHYESGKVLEEDGRLQGAVAAYARELRIHPAHLRAAAGLVRTLGRLGLHGHENAIRTSALAFHQRAAAAVHALAAAAASDSTGTELSAGAAQRISESLPVFPKNGEHAWRERARNALLADQPETVVELLRNPDDSVSEDQMRYWRARADLALGRASRSLEGLLELHARQPGNAEFSYYLQACAERLALESLELFASLAPGSYRTHQLRAEHHASANEVDAAIAEYAKALALAPGASQLHLAVGSLYLGQRNYSAALAAFQAELKNDPYSVAALARMGEAYFLLGQTADTDKVLKRAIAINPDSGSSHKTLGRAYFRKREYPKAVEHLQEALRLGIREDEDLHYHLGRALRMTGNLEEAAEHLAIVSRLKEARQTIAQDRLEASVAEPTDAPSGTQPR